MDRYRLANAIDKVRGYFLTRPHEDALGLQEEAFKRAKDQCLAALLLQIKDIESLTWDQFKAGGPTAEKVLRDACAAFDLTYVPGDRKP